MFTGIITDIGTIISREQRGDTRLTIATAYDPASIELGASIACSGICLTVVEKGTDAHGHWFAVDASAETLARTTLGNWHDGTRINLERALKMGDELGGHLVTGHVDGTGTIEAVETSGDSTLLTITVPEAIARMTAEKGSLCVDGVSLTVNEITKTSSKFNIIPHTLHATTLGELTAGAPVNLEIDLIARYVSRLALTKS